MVLLQARQMEQRAGLQKTGLVQSRSDMWMLGVSLQGPEINDTTHFTPFFLVYGRDPILPLDTLLRPKFKYMGEDNIPTMLQTLHIAYTHVKENTLEARERNKAYIARNAASQE